MNRTGVRGDNKGIHRKADLFAHSLYLSITPCKPTALVVPGDLAEDAKVRIADMDGQIQSLRKMVPHIDGKHWRYKNTVAKHAMDGEQ